LKHIFAICLLAAMPTLAWADKVPSQMQGIWATPTCTAAQDTLAFFDGFYLWLGEDETTLSGIELANSQPEEFTRLEESDGYPNFFQILPDGRLREAFLPEDAELTATPDDTWATTDYESCGGTLPSDKVLLHGEALAMLMVASRAQDACKQNQATCATTLFTGIDVTGDGNLSTAELARLFRVAGYLAAVSEDDGATDDDLATVLATSLPIAPLMASAIINSFDYDDNGALSLAEISQDRAAGIEGLEPNASNVLGSRVDRMKDTLKPLGRLLENFKP